MRPNYFDFTPYRSRGPYRRLDEGSPCAMAAELLAAIPALLRLWRQRLGEREQLARLDARMLRDIGITPFDADAECNKPFWRA